MLSGARFVFVNRRGNQMKTSFFDDDGYAAWSKLHEQGEFVTPDAHRMEKPLDYTELQCLLNSIEWKNAQRYKRFSLPHRAAE